jgi:hypothetical protein
VNPRAVLAKATTGKVHKVARWVFVAPPETVVDPARWRPGFEAAAGAVGTAIFGPEAVVAVGMTAARRASRGVVVIPLTSTNTVGPVGLEPTTYG